MSLGAILMITVGTLFSFCLIMLFHVERNSWKVTLFGMSCVVLLFTVFPILGVCTEVRIPVETQTIKILYIDKTPSQILVFHNDGVIKSSDVTLYNNHTNLVVSRQVFRNHFDNIIYGAYSLSVKQTK
jgi:apolipoprotein N-acyltransferase